MQTSSPLRIGTRESPLAIAQTRQVRERLAAFHPSLAIPGAIIEILIRTRGDILLERSLAEVGGKGLFTKEIDEALLRGTIDLAVHSMKDMQTVLPAGLVLAAVLERTDPRDAFVSLRASSLATLPAGAVVGTASLRRSAQVYLHRPDLKVVPLRGNVQTRLRKLADGIVDATLLAIAGLHRLGLAEQATTILPVEVMLPAVAQGAIGVVCRVDDGRTCRNLKPLNHAPTALCVAAERAFLAILDGNCRTPIAGLAELTETGAKDNLEEAQVRFRGLVVGHDCTLLKIERCGPARQAVSLAEDAGQVLLACAAPVLKVGS